MHNITHTFSDLATRYDGFIIDLWGVVHDGTQLYPHAKAALEFLRLQHKPVVFLSNAPRRAEAAQTNLDRLGIPRDYYLQVITSGEVAYQALAANQGWLGTRYYYLGPGKDENIAEGLTAYTRASTLEDADFVLNTGYEYDFQPHDDVLTLLHNLHQHQLPLLCVNPDLEVVKQDGTHMLCAGTLAAAYEAIGGTVHYVGKPHARVYDAARKAFADHDSRFTIHTILAIGDNPLTDILGANQQNIDSLLITGGVLAHHHGVLNENEARLRCEEHGAAPTYVQHHFSA